MRMKKEAIIRKFGDQYIADERTFKMGIDRRITAGIAERFRDRRVLETCTGGGFSTISLARKARHVITIEIDKKIQDEAKQNVARAGLGGKVDFILGDSLDGEMLLALHDIHAAFLDPDWADTGNDHVYRFRNSNTKPPADLLLEKVFKVTRNVALILPPLLHVEEFLGLPGFETQRIFMGDEHVLFCLYFGDLAERIGESEWKIIDG